MPIQDGRLVSRSVAIDTQTIDAGALSEGIDFFSLDSDDVGDKVLDEIESSLLNWMFNDLAFRRALLEELGFQCDVRWHLELKEPALPEGWRGLPGDVDVLLVPEDPREVVAIEVKRFKVTVGAKGDHVGARTGTRMKRAVEQVLGLREIGFHKIMFMILVPSDSRSSTARNVLCMGPEGRTLMRLANQARKLGLHQDAGILTVTINQPTSKGFRRFVQVSACLIQAAKGRAQDPSLTERLVNAIEKGW